jgi:Na+/proline symporter
MNLHEKNFNSSNLGTSTEIYLYGYQYAYILVGYVIATIIIHYTVIPIYHELQITSAYEVGHVCDNKR